MKIFVTGATGFIGRAFCRVALNRGHQVLALCRKAGAMLPAGVEVTVGTLATTLWRQVETFEPEAVIHLAWVATPGVYLTSPENDVWLANSKAWFERLRKMGVPYVAGTGTCIEYAASDEPLNEATSPLAPGFAYSCAKTELFQWLREGAMGNSVNWSWLRVFYPYGPGEHANRICTSLIKQLRAGKSLALRTPHSVKDYIFIDDLAEGMCAAIEAGAMGAINFGSGHGIAVQDLALRLAVLLNADPALVQHSAEPGHDPFPVVIADNSRLRATGWRLQTPLDAGLQRLIDSLPAAP